MMPVTPSIVQYEFIGLKSKVVKCLNPHVVGLTGRVVEETRNTFTLLHGDKRKVVVKDTAIFEFAMSNGTIVELDGKLVMGRPEDRLKKRPRRMW